MFEATIRYLTPEEGGRNASPENAARSQLELGGLQTSCIVHAADERLVLPLGEDIEVFIELIFAGRFEREVSELTDIVLLEGSKVVAIGRRKGVEGRS